MLNLGLPTGVASSIDVRLKTTVGKGSPVYSQIQKISVTPYALFLYVCSWSLSGWNPPTAC
jgi:hypothetical protein